MKYSKTFCMQSTIQPKIPFKYNCSIEIVIISVKYSKCMTDEYNILFIFSAKRIYNAFAKV